jgi:hypothetical protein
MIKKLLQLLSLLFIISCKQNVSNEKIVYSNDFQGSNLSGISNGTISLYNASAVLGRYNQSQFSLVVDNLPRHDLITITFDLYIHDSWDGNKSSPDGPDIWEMLVDENKYISTTFSNDSCPVGNFCPPQSYPFDYPNYYNNPKTGSYRNDLPGVCHFAGNPNGTTQYKIKKTFTHSNSTLLLKCLDKLVQTNANDTKCDESWSVDNIVIKAITL